MPVQQQKLAARPDAEYLNANPFEGDECEIACRRVALVVTRQSHHCAASDLTWISDSPHEIPKGTRAWKESAKVEGKFGTCYCCLSCIDAHLNWLEEQYS